MASAGECAGTTEASSRIQVTPCRVLSAICTPGSVPCRAAAAAHVRRRGGVHRRGHPRQHPAPPLAIPSSARSSAGPACDTIAVPSAATSSPFSQPVAFTLQVLLDLGSGKDVGTPIVPSQEHFP